MAPQTLQRPLLPYRTKKERLVFCLCAKCADNEVKDNNCKHSVKQRSWISGYTHVELNKALSIGYSVLEVHEVWNYTMWASRENKNSLFEGYVNTFLKWKVESTGYPASVKSDEDKQKFIENYLISENIDLNKNCIDFNPGLRFISKILLNSLWGKFAQNSHLNRVVVTASEEEFFKYVLDDSIEFVDVLHISEVLDRITYRKRTEFEDSPLTNNLPIAVFVTSLARLHLYKYLEMLGNSVLYCDTDSVIFLRDKSKPIPIEIADSLGCMSQEYPGYVIQEFLSAGPKNYGLKIKDKKTKEVEYILKIRGFSLTYNASQKLTFENMKKQIFKLCGKSEESEIDNDVVVVPYKKFRRTKTGKIYNVEMNKNYRAVYTKGVIVDDFDTLPFGYLNI